MARIGRLVSSVPRDLFFQENWNGPLEAEGTDFSDAIFTAEGALPDLANAILTYMRKGNLGVVERAVARLNKIFKEKYESILHASLWRMNEEREKAYSQMQFAVDKVNALVEEVANRELIPLSMRTRQGRLRQQYGEVYFASPKTADRIPLNERAVFGVEDTSSNNAIMFSLVGAGLGYALAPKNRGMAAGVGAVAGYIGSTLLK